MITLLVSLVNKTVGFIHVKWTTQMAQKEEEEEEEERINVLISSVSSVVSTGSAHWVLLCKLVLSKLLGQLYIYFKYILHKSDSVCLSWIHSCICLFNSSRSAFVLVQLNLFAQLNWIDQD